MSDFATHRFDEVVRVALNDATEGDLVLHRNAAGELFAWHSPLDNGIVYCRACDEPGTRVYLEGGTT